MQGILGMFFAQYSFWSKHIAAIDTLWIVLNAATLSVKSSLHLSLNIFNKNIFLE